MDLLFTPSPEATLFDVVASEEQLEMALGFPVTLISRASLDPQVDQAFFQSEIPLC